MNSLVSIRNLEIGFEGAGALVRGLNLEIPTGKTVGLVGESGSGKSLTSLALMGLLPPSAQTSGEVIWNAGEGVKSLLSLPEQERQSLRGKELSMIFQEPMTALNPSIRCGRQVAETIRLHQRLGKQEAMDQAAAWFERVKLPRVSRLLRAYPHELSGGQRQRVMIAMALANRPKLLIADEPTTALDVTVQKAVLDLLKELQEEMGMSMLFISHDLGVVGHMANSIAVLYKGDLVEQGDSAELLSRPQHPYTRGLLACRPGGETHPRRLPTVADFLQGRAVDETSVPRPSAEGEVILHLEQVNTWFGGRGWLNREEPVKAVQGVSLELREGETLGLVGESGCGKSTLGRTLLGLVPATSGSISYRGQELTRLRASGWKSLRKEIQIIFQDPYSSLNPRIRVGDALTEPMKVHGLGGSARGRNERAVYLLERVGLKADDMKKYPHAFSGGQRQRLGISRALAVEPKVIVCDESVSALDVSVQAQVLNLLNELQEEQGFSYLFISHDLHVVHYMSDHVAVMQAGRIVEFGEAGAVYQSPRAEYTRFLLGARL